MLNGKVRQQSIKSIEVINIVRIELMKMLKIHPLHLFATTCKVSNAIHKLFGQVWMFLECIINVVKAALFALEPLVGDCYKLNVATEV